MDKAVIGQLSESLATPVYPVQVNWDLAMARRSRVLAVDPDMHHYLLFPEVQAILDHALDGHIHFFIDTLWHTGARLNEALKLTPASFNLAEPENSDVLLHTLKQRGPGRPKKGVIKPAQRLVPIPYPGYIERVRRYLATHKPKPGEPLFPFSDKHYRNKVVDVRASMTAPPPIKVTPHTFRHSYAVNLLYHGRSVAIVQMLLGHKSRRSTEVYTKIFSGDVHHLLAGVQFD